MSHAEQLFEKIANEAVEYGYRLEMEAIGKEAGAGHAVNRITRVAMSLPKAPSVATAAKKLRIDALPASKVRVPPAGAATKLPPVATKAPAKDIRNIEKAILVKKQPSPFPGLPAEPRLSLVERLMGR